MALLKRAFVAGLAHELKVQGLVKWASPEMEETATNEIADNLGEEIPEGIPEDGLDPEEAEEILNTIIEVSEELANKTGSVNLELNKTAAAMSYEDAAASTAIRLMEKAAEETLSGTGPDVPGQGTPQEVEGPTAETQIDKIKTPSSDLVVSQGQTSLDTSQGSIGKEETQTEQPGAVDSPPTGEASKLASLFSKLGIRLEKTAAIDGASLSGGVAGGPTPTPRKDIEDNLDIPGVVAKAQGKTVQDIPASAQLGALIPQKSKPGPTDATPNDPAKDALSKQAAAMMQSKQGRAILQKMAQVYEELSPQYQSTAEEAAANILGNLAAGLR